MILIAESICDMSVEEGVNNADNIGDWELIHMRHKKIVQHSDNAQYKL